MKQKIQEIKATVEEHLSNAKDLKSLDDLRVKYLGKKGELTAVLKGMGKLSSEERPVIGALANQVREFLEDEIAHKKAELGKIIREEKMKAELSCE